MKPGNNYASENIISGNNAETGVVYGITPNGRRSKYFCSHCRVYGHSIERCYNVHGHPTGNGQVPVGHATGNRDGFKGKRVANNLQSGYYEESNSYQGTYLNAYEGQDPQPGNSDLTPHLTQEKYSQLPALLSQHKVLVLMVVKTTIPLHS